MTRRPRAKRSSPYRTKGEAPADEPRGVVLHRPAQPADEREVAPAVPRREVRFSEDELAHMVSRADAEARRGPPWWQSWLVPGAIVVLGAGAMSLRTTLGHVLGALAALSTYAWWVLRDRSRREL